MTKILIIDDDLTFQFFLSKVFRTQGYEVSVASNGEDGLIKARKLKPALIICDWMMPGMDGLEVCKKIKADPNLLTTFFILLTARGDVAEDRIIGLETGADDFLAKPILNINELRARIRAGLRLHQLSQDLQTQKQRLEAELTDAADYVRSLLPVPMNGHVAIDSRFIPSKQLGGDCFDYYWLTPDELVLYLLDVSGHGVGSALLSTSVLNLLRSQSLNVQFNKPSAVLTALNDTFQMAKHKDLYFTIWYGVYNRTKRRLTYASAGHPPAILLTPISTEEYESSQIKTIGPPIGMLPDVKFVDGSCEIGHRATLYIYSDGIYEITLPNGEMWSLDEFIEALTQQWDFQRSNLTRLLRGIHRIRGKTTFDDDVSLLQINFN
jgi:sigma-B regulation protein RsbU (phosphoserine phosphatase)